MTFNKKFLLTGAVVSAALAVGSFLAVPAKAVTSTLDVEAVIIAPLTINCTGAARELNFGSIDANGGGTVTVSTAGVGSTTGPILIALTGLQEGQCDLTGEGNLAFTVTIPATTVDDAGAGVPMAVNNFQVDDGTGAGPAVAGYSANLVAGAETIAIGADLVVGAAQAAGNYVGTVTVTAVYQ